MADKDSKEELERKKRAEAEIFGKTMGFTHTPSPEELERTVILTRAPQQEPADQDFESTVRFNNFDAMVESSPSSDKEALPQQPAPARPTPPPATPPQAKAPAPAPQKPAAPKVEARPQQPKAPVTPPATPPQAKAPAPAPQKPAAPKVEPAVELPVTPAAHPRSELDFAESEFTLSGSLLGGDESTEKPSSDSSPSHAPEATFDSGAALDELDELLKMDFPDDVSSAQSEPEASKEPDSVSDSLGRAALFGDDEEFNITMSSLPTVQLGAEDLAEDDDLLADVGDDDLLAVDDGDDDLSTEFAMDDLDRDLPVAEEVDAQEGLMGLSGFDASLEEDRDDVDEGAEPEDDENEFLDAGERETGMDDWDNESFEQSKEKSATPKSDDTEDDTDFSFTDQDKEEQQESESLQDDLPLADAMAKPAVSPVAADERIEQAPPVTVVKRGGSGFAIFLSLLALAGAGASYWFSQGGLGGFSPISTQLEEQLAQTADRLSRVESSNRELAVQVQTLNEKNNALEQKLNALTPSTDRTQAGKKKAAAKSHPAIQPSTPLESTTKAPAKPKAEGYVINLTSVSSAESANQEIARLKQLGVSAEAVRTEARGKTWYRIRVPGFSTLQDAEAQSAVLGEKLGIKDIWVGKR